VVTVHAGYLTAAERAWSAQKEPVLAVVPVPEWVLIHPLEKMDRSTLMQLKRIVANLTSVLGRVVVVVLPLSIVIVREKQMRFVGRHRRTQTKAQTTRQNIRDVFLFSSKLGF